MLELLELLKGIAMRYLLPVLAVMMLVSSPVRAELEESVRKRYCQAAEQAITMT